MIENNFLLDHIGKTKTQNLLDDIGKQALEIKSKLLGIKDNSINPLSIVTSGKENEINQIGMSCVNDLLLDNFGALFNVAINRTTSSMIFNVGLPNGLKTYKPTGSDSYLTNQVIPIGSQVRLGQSSTPPQLDDFIINDPFVGGIESTYKGTSNAFYTEGLSKVQNSTQFSPIANDGTIRETGFFMGLKDTSGSDILRVNMISHDLISPVVNIFTSDQVNVDYSFIFN